ncbi:MAG: hypothetical protein LBK53_03425 [Heliobacteriaceae bacterium]|jgi:hypothetical protein|nr:hypothetical protein [Heliobacteriaceae bacterium]
MANLVEGLNGLIPSPSGRRWYAVPDEGFTVINSYKTLTHPAGTLSQREREKAIVSSLRGACAASDEAIQSKPLNLLDCFAGLTPFSQ